MPERHFYNPMMNIKFGARAEAASRYGSGSAKMIRLLVAPAPQHTFKRHFSSQIMFSVCFTVPSIPSVISPMFLKVQENSNIACRFFRLKLLLNEQLKKVN
jgi:hypothetical protein